MRSMLIGLGLALAVASSPALAQEEGPSSVAAGGLVIDPAQPIEIVSQDLFVSRDAVRLRYVLRNRGAGDLTVPISFSIPDRPALRHGLEMRWPNDVRASVDGAPVALQVERRALIGDQDHGETLTRLGVPILYQEEAEFEPAERALAALPREEQVRLAGLGLIDIFDAVNGPRRLIPLWTVGQRWHWQQVFPAGRDVVVEHSYVPGLIGSNTVGLNAYAIRNSEYGQDQIRRFCLDDAYLAGVDRLSGGEEMHALTEATITLVHGQWPSPIGEFRLVVDRGDAGNLASFCGEGVQAIGPTQVELRRTNWQPQGEMQFIFLAREAN